MLPPYPSAPRRGARTSPHAPPRPAASPTPSTARPPSPPWGAIAAIANSACGYACLTRMPEGSAVLTVEFKINLLAPARGHRFTAKARALRVGRTLAVATAEVLAHTDSQPDVCIALMQATMMRVEPKNGAGG
ncbi:MAG: PaaI family thioesterase [Phycisphaerales bacterium]